MPAPEVMVAGKVVLAIAIVRSGLVVHGGQPIQGLTG